MGQTDFTLSRLQPSQQKALDQFLQQNYLSPHYLEEHPPATQSNYDQLSHLWQQNHNALQTEPPALSDLDQYRKESQQVLGNTQIGFYDRVGTWYCNNTHNIYDISAQNKNTFGCTSSCCTYNHNVYMQGDLGGGDKHDQTPHHQAAVYDDPARVRSMQTPIRSSRRMRDQLPTGDRQLHRIMRQLRRTNGLPGLDELLCAGHRRPTQVPGGGQHQHHQLLQFSRGPALRNTSQHHHPPAEAAVGRWHAAVPDGHIYDPATLRRLKCWV